MRTPVFWRAHGTHERAICKLLRQRTVDSNASLCNVLKRCTMMRSTRPCAAATARKSHARALYALYAHTSFLARAWNART
eukprot:171787-Lingulodinium_polyedra.AAC.1